jgi:hypothetical protein
LSVTGIQRGTVSMKSTVRDWPCSDAAATRSTASVVRTTTRWRSECSASTRTASFSQVRTAIEPAKLFTERRMPLVTGTVWSAFGRRDGGGVCAAAGAASDAASAMSAMSLMTCVSLVNRPR